MKVTAHVNPILSFLWFVFLFTLPLLSHLLYTVNAFTIDQWLCFIVFTARCTIMQSVVLLSHVVCPSVCPSVTLVDHDHTRTYTAVLRLCGICPGQPGWTKTRRNIHPLHSSWSSIIPICFLHLLWSMASSVFNPRALFPQSLSKFSLVYLLACYPPLYTPYISSANHCLLFAAHAHTIATYSAVVLRLCLLIPVSLSTLYLELYLVTSHHTSILPFSSLPSEVPPHYARQHICYSTYMLWQFRLSVRLSVTWVDQTKTVEARITQFPPYSSPIPLVFRG